ncbi:hypothetical protein BpHYR1_013149 [Brachionus plicatilis]|uniref:Uncharacterized protein n=1 Tax=Brachionus plicatilis TaxID=10195 RepID=A0A3M7RRC9_BRAPC|nr:hypothetical protein BpHYR1_013149 [Brachionus plicatilis]
MQCHLIILNILNSLIGFIFQISFFTRNQIMKDHKKLHFIYFITENLRFFFSNRFVMTAELKKKDLVITILDIQYVAKRNSKINKNLKNIICKLNQET